MTFDLAGAVGQLEPVAVLPPRRVGEEERLRPPLRLVGALPLPGGRWVTVVADDAGTRLGVPLVADGATVRRATAGDGVAAALVEALVEATGAVPRQGLALHRLVAEQQATRRLPGERALAVDQTHDSVVVGEAVVVKWAVHLSVGLQQPPAVRLLRHLAEVGFVGMPRPVGWVDWADPSGSGDRALVAVAAEFLPGARDGWDWYVDDLLDPLAGGRPLDAAVEPATALGTLTGSLHRALAQPSSTEPHPVGVADERDAARWHARALATLDEALAVTPGPERERLRARADRARSALEPLAVAAGTPVTLVHGDLHVGQVLRHDGGYAVTDFDGNPVLPADERSAPQPPARDVAGMLRSLDHVGRIADRRTAGRQAGAVERWIAATRTAFLEAYDGPLLDHGLLPACEVEQELRELVYAARHLPRWRYVPDAALAALLSAGEG